MRCFVNIPRDSLLLLQPTSPPDGSVYSHSSRESQTLSYHHHHHHNHQTCHSSWPAWDLLPCLSSGSLTSWTSELFSLHSYCLDLEGSPSSAFEEILNSILHFQTKIPVLFPPDLETDQKNWTEIGHSTIWTLFVIFGYLLFLVVYTDMSDFP